MENDTHPSGQIIQANGARMEIQTTTEVHIKYSISYNKITQF